MKLRLPFLAEVVLPGIIFLGAAGSRADELKLKDGTKISGTIVGFEENSFKVQTSYGFAVVQKDQVLSISMSNAAKKAEEPKKPAEAEKKSEPEKKVEAKKKPETEKKPDIASENSSAPAPMKDEAKDEPVNAASSPKDSKETKAAATNGAPANAATTATAGATTSAQPKPQPAAKNGTSAKNAAAPKSVTPPSPTVAANTQPPPPPAPKPEVPEVIHEQVNGNTYTNDTYGFHMYKPPDWQVIDGARSLLPGAITAMGTADQTTYLLIGQEPAGKPLTASMDATDKRLREVMENFRPLGDKNVMVSGTAAVERRFRGSVDQHDWSGVVAIVPHGTRVYTIFGMTYADTDLVQIQENVITRAISSLQFTQQ
jgi:hypothetical protein